MDARVLYKYFSVLVALFIFSYICWYSYSTQVITVDPNSLPIIKAKKHIKSKPENPGGIEIANLDKGIYDYISGREKKNKKIVASYSRENAVSREELSKILASKNPTQISNQNLAKKTSDKKKTFTQEKFYLRVAKIKSAYVYDKALAILLKKHGSILSKLGSILYREKKSEGVKYYMHFGPLYSKGEATILCNKIIANDGRCEVFS